MSAPTTPIPETRNVPLTAAEANVLLAFIDLAVKAKGLEAAEAALVLSKRIQAAFAPQEPTHVPDARA